MLNHQHWNGSISLCYGIVHVDRHVLNANYFMWARMVSRSTYNCDVSPADHSASATNGISRIIGTCKRGAAFSSLRQKQDLIQTAERALSFNHDKRQNKIATVSTTTSRTPPTDWQTRQEHNIKQIGVATMPQDTSLLVTCCKLFSTAATACSCKTSIRNAGKGWNLVHIKAPESVHCSAGWAIFCCRSWTTVPVKCVTSISLLKPVHESTEHTVLKQDLTLGCKQDSRQKNYRLVHLNMEPEFWIWTQSRHCVYRWQSLFGTNLALHQRWALPQHCDGDKQYTKHRRAFQELTPDNDFLWNAPGK